jgi:SAM-dependent methyltransferase
MESRYYETYYRHETEHWWFRWRFKLIQQVLDGLDLPRNARMLDAGCGTGQMLKTLQRRGEAVGLDISPEAIAFAASRGAENLVLGTVTAPPFREGSFDVALALDVIEHVDDDRAMLKGLRSLVKPNGAVIITVPAFTFLWSEHDVINHHRRRYRTDELQSRIEQAGLEVDRMTYCNTTLFPVVALMRLGQRALRSFRKNLSDEVNSDLHGYPGPVNEVLYRLMLLETKLLRRVDMPVGVSILAIARRPGTDVIENVEQNVIESAEAVLSIR